MDVALDCVSEQHLQACWGGQLQTSASYAMLKTAVKSIKSSARNL